MCSHITTTASHHPKKKKKKFRFSLLLLCTEAQSLKRHGWLIVHGKRRKREWGRQRRKKERQREGERKKGGRKKKTEQLKSFFFKKLSTEEMNVWEKDGMCWFDNDLSLGPCGQYILLCVIWFWYRERIVSSFILSHKTYCLSPYVIHTHPQTTIGHDHSWWAAYTNTSKWSHTSATQILFNKSFNCLINARRAMQMKPIVDKGWVRLNIHTLTHAADQSAHCAKNPGLNHSSVGITLNHYPDPRANLAWDTKQKNTSGSFRPSITEL